MLVIETPEGFVGGYSHGIVNYVSEPEYAYDFVNIVTARKFALTHLQGVTISFNVIN